MYQLITRNREKRENPIILPLEEKNQSNKFIKKYILLINNISNLLGPCYVPDTAERFTFMSSFNPHEIILPPAYERERSCKAKAQLHGYITQHL